MKKLILLMTILGAFSMNVYSQDSDPNLGIQGGLKDCGDGIDTPDRSPKLLNNNSTETPNSGGTGTTNEVIRDKKGK